MGPIALVFFVLLIIGTVLYIALVLPEEGFQAGVLPTPRIPAEPQDTDLTMEYEWRVYDADGEELDVGAFRGKALFVNIWATWSPLAVEEIPAIQRLYDQVADEEGIAVLAIAMDSPNSVRHFAERNNITMPVYSTRHIPDKLDTQTIPTTYVVAPDGRVVFEHTRAAAWDEPVVVEFLRQLAPAP